MSQLALRAAILAGAALYVLPTFAQENSQNEKSQDQKSQDLVITPNRLPMSIQQIGSSVSVITQDEIEKQGNKSLYDVFVGLPGVHSVENGGPGGFVSVFIRGAEARHTLVLIDGVRIGDPTSTGNEVDLSLVAPEDIDRIEVIRGPQSALYGSDALGGVINIITKKGRKGPPVWRLRSEGGSYGTFANNLSVSGATDDTTYSIGVDQFQTDGFKRYGYRIPRLAWLHPNGSDPLHRNSGYLRVSKKLNDWLTFETGLQAGWSHIQFDGGELSPLAPYIPNFQTAWQGSAYQKMVAENGPFRTTLSTFETRFVKDIQTYGVYDDGYGHAISYDTPYHYKGTRMGAEVQEDIRTRVGTVTFGSRYEAEKSETSSASDRKQSTQSAFVLYQVSPIDKLNLSLGTRVDDVSTFGSFLTWRATSAYALTSSTRVHASYGTGAKAPSLYQLFDPGNGNASLKPEKSIGFDAGVEQTFFDGDARVDATFFHNKITNLIDWVPTDGPWVGKYFNVIRARVSGTEVSAEYNLIPTFAKVKLAYTWLDTHIDPNPTDPFDIDNGARLLRRPSHSFRVSVPMTPALDWTVEPILRFVGSRADKTFDPDGNEVRVELKPYVRLDANVQYKLNRDVSFFVRAENLTNTKYENVYNYGTAGRSGYAGLQVTW